jgi:hypothetical protein
MEGLWLVQEDGGEGERGGLDRWKSSQQSHSIELETLLSSALRVEISISGWGRERVA